MQLLLFAPPLIFHFFYVFKYDFKELEFVIFLVDIYYTNDSMNLNSSKNVVLYISLMSSGLKLSNKYPRKQTAPLNFMQNVYCTVQKYLVCIGP